MTAADWHRAVIATERDLTAYFARWSRVHPPVPERSWRGRCFIALALAAAAGGLDLRRE